MKARFGADRIASSGKLLVDSGQRFISPCTNSMPEENLTEQEAAEVVRCLQHGRKIEAIKRYREFTGTGLKEAKEAVEAMDPGVETGSSVDETHGHPHAKKSGCGSSVFLLGLLAMILYGML
jgi:hypothetical protein